MSFLDELLALLPYLASLLVSSVCAAVLLWDHHGVAGRKELGFMMVAVALWSLITLFDDASATLDSKVFWRNAGFLATATTVVLVYRFGWSLWLRAPHPSRLASRLARWAVVVPLALAALVWADPWTGWVRSNFSLSGTAPFFDLQRQVSPLYWVFIISCYLLVAAALTFWGRYLWNSRSSLRWGSVLGFLSVFLVLITNILTQLGLNPWPSHDPTPASFTLVGLIFMVSMSQQGFLSLIPAAREAVMDAFPVPLLVFDSRGHLLSWNSLASDRWKLTERDRSKSRNRLEPDRLSWLPSPPAPGSRTNQTVLEPPTGATWIVDERALGTKSHFRGSLLSCQDVTVFERRVAERTSELQAAYTRLNDELQHRRRTEDQLFYYSLHDPLTGLGNRSLFLSRLSQAKERRARDPEAGFGVAMLNFRQFRLINERQGFGAGDEFLVQASLRLGRSIRTIDTAARASADTFLLLCEGILERDTFVEAMVRVTAAVEEPLVLQGQSLIPSVSLGLVWGTPSTQSPEELLSDAEFALERARLPDSSAIVAFDPEWRRAAHDRHQLKDDFGRALIAGELHLVYQPIVNLKTGQVEGFEALTRWNHPLRGMVPPDVFIPLAEKEGTIRPLGLWVLREAARQFVALGLNGDRGGSVYVSVNASPRQLAEPDFAGIVLGVLEREGLAPDRLCLEITETALVENSEALVPVLESLRREGIGIKLDDFGTGYSSLHSLSRLPVDTLKIDRSFIGDLPRGRPIVSTVLTLATEFGLDVVAEGVETQEQVSYLIDMGCPSGQGYLYSRGWTGSQLEAWGRGEEPHA